MFNVVPTQAPSSFKANSSPSASPNWELSRVALGHLGQALSARGSSGLNKNLDTPSTTERQGAGSPEALSELDSPAPDAAALDHLRFERANKLAGILNVTQDLTLTLSLEQLTRVLTLDPNALKAYIAGGHSLAEIAALSAEETSLLNNVSPALAAWLNQFPKVSLVQLAHLDEAGISTLQEAMSPAFAMVQSDELIHDIKPESISYPVALGSGILTLETADGRKLIVSDATTPVAYKQALGLLTGRSQQQIDQVRSKYGIAPLADTRIMERATQTPRDTNDPNAGSMSVGESAIKKLIDRYRSGYVLKHGTSTTEGSIVTYRLDDGSEIKVDKNRLKTDQAKGIFDHILSGRPVTEDELKHLESDEGSEDLFEGDDWDTWMRFVQALPKDNPRAQFVRAFDARGALANGYGLLPFYESPDGLGGTFRTYPGGENNPTEQDMSGADVHDLLNESAVNNRIMSLMADPGILAEYQDALRQEAMSLPDQKQLSDTLFNNLTGSGYIDALRDLKEQGLSYEAQQMTQGDLATLQLLDPDRATEAARTLRINSLRADFDDIKANPSAIEPSTFKQATIDGITLTIKALNASFAAVRAGTQSVVDLTKYLNETLADKKSVEELSKVIRQLVIDAKTTGNMLNIDDADFKEAMERAYVPTEYRGKLATFFATTQKYGVWGSVGGGIALASFAYKLSQGAWTPDSTAMERWGAARDIILFLSVLGPMSNTVAGTVDYFRGVLGSTGEADKAWKALGLNHTLPQVWDKESFLPGGKSWSDSWSELWSRYDKTSGLATASDETRPMLQNAADRLSNIWLEKQKPELFSEISGLKQRVGVSALKVLGAVTDLGGIADIVVGALGIQKAAAAGDVGGKVTESMRLLAGVGLTGAGVIGTASLFATVPAVVAASAAPLFFVGVVFCFGGFFAALSTAFIKRHNRLQDACDKQTEWFQDLADDGLAAADWRDKLEYLRYAFAYYGNDNTDPSQSYIDRQRIEWEFFQRTRGKDGSSLNRLNNELHLYSDKTWNSPQENIEFNNTL